MSDSMNLQLVETVVRSLIKGVEKKLKFSNFCINVKLK